MFTIELKGLPFYARHGVFAAEQELGARFVVDIAVTADLSHAAAHDSLAGTIDYGQLYALIAEEMAIPRKLIETVAYHIGQRALRQFAQAQQVQVCVHKPDPPLAALCPEAVVTYTCSR